MKSLQDSPQSFKQFQDTDDTNCIEINGKIVRRTAILLDDPGMAMKKSSFKPLQLSERETLMTYTRTMETNYRQSQFTAEMIPWPHPQSYRSIQRRQVSSHLQLKQTASTLIYVCHRNNITKYLSWQRYVVHFLPYPISLTLVWLMQLAAFGLMQHELNHAPDGGSKNVIGTPLVAARIIAILMLCFYCLKSGTQQNAAIKCIGYDAVMSKNKCFWFYLFFPILQGIIEMVALAVSSDVVIRTESTIDVFKAAMSCVVILQMGDWITMTIPKRALGVTDEMFTIHVEDHSGGCDKKVSFILNFVLTCSRLVVLCWDVCFELSSWLL